MLFNIFYSLSTATLALAATPGAAPLLRRGTCKPNLQGNFVSIFTPCGSTASDPFPAEEFNAENRLGAPIVQSYTTNPGHSVPSRFLVEFTGQPSNTYHIKLVSNTERNLQAAMDGSGSAFTLQQIIYDNSQSGSQNFDLECEECSPNDGSTNPVFGRRCIIRNNASGRCVTSDFASGQGCSPDGKTNSLTFMPCDGTARQLFGIRQVMEV